ncbi:MAG: tetratricopeptide repeat protein [Mycobacterium leprae]
MSYHPTGPATGVEEYERILTLMDERRFEEALIRGRVLLEATDTDSPVRCKTHNLICWLFIEGTKHPTPEAVLHGEEAVRLADQIGWPQLKAESLCNLASAYFQIGDYQAAQETYQAMVNLLTANPSYLPVGLTLAHQGLAQLALTQGRPEEAIQLLGAAEAACTTEEARILLPDLYRRRALAYVKANQPDKAAETLTQIPEGAFASGPRSLWWKTHLRFTVARIELARGHFTAARPQVLNALALARELGDLPVIAECSCLLALIDHAEGRKEAHKRARAAITYAIHSGRRDVLEDVRERLNAYQLGEL